VHIPLIVKLPADRSPAHRSVDAQVRILDILPTVFELVGVEQPGTFVGASLMPLMMGDETADRLAYCESTLYGADRIALRSDRYKIIYDMDPDRQKKAELYDWRDDPGERRNLIDSDPVVAEQLLSELRVLAGELTQEARKMSELEPTTLSPSEVESLKSLGYIR
jgi:arylsulfatase A-like enzyme